MDHPQRHYFEEKVGWRWGVFLSDDDYQTKVSALDTLFFDRHTAFCVAMQMQTAYRVGVHAGAKNPALADTVM